MEPVTLGFPISHKENERRRITPETLFALTSEGVHCVVERGYGEALGYGDVELESHGITVASRSATLDSSVICDPKAGDGDYLPSLREDQVLFGWLHAVQGRETARELIRSGCTAVAWEDMFSQGRHVFWANNFLAGEAAIMHVSLLRGTSLRGAAAAVIGRGNVAQGAISALHRAGADVEFFGRGQEQGIRDHLCEFDLLVNAVLWDTTRTDHIITRENLSSMRRGSWIVDISCDRSGAIATCEPTTIENPTYSVDGIVHYSVDHTPSLLHVDASRAISAAAAPYLLALGHGGWREVSELRQAVVIEHHRAVDPRVADSQDGFE